ncbi:4-hydroxy-tetrahydrodipicolinate reductase [Granulosicoccus sp. 3-233]|uniref:4-hydroxy-tetrahydrodipicolinate reductase n=1 Tax=Granulosicoccus sp. 3-233 TaxID=3417969 RepID=UPI003D32E14D
MISLSVNGAAGRMGRQLLAAIDERDDARIGAAADAPGQACIGVDTSVLAGGSPSGVQVADNVAALASGSDVIIDFTAPSVSLALLDALQGLDTRVVIGTTGFSGEQLTRLHEHAVHRPILFAPNYSVGVTVTLSLLQQAARAFGDDYDVEIIEAHHRHKVDAPSGTALKMGEVVADALERDLASCAVYGREGITGARDSRTIGFETIRAGDIIGEHTVLFAGAGERIEITHKATDRMTFARGAVRGAVWLASQPSGLYDMTHVLGLDSQRG